MAASPIEKDFHLFYTQYSRFYTYYDVGVKRISPPISMKQLFAYRQAVKRIFCTYGTVIYETTCQSDVRPTIFKRALEGGCKGETRTAQLGWFPPCCSFLKITLLLVQFFL